MDGGMEGYNSVLENHTIYTKELIKIEGGMEAWKERSYFPSTKEQESVIGQGTTNEFKRRNSSSKNDGRCPLKQEKEYG